MVRRVGSNVLVVGDNGKLVLVSPAGSSLLKHVSRRWQNLPKQSVFLTGDPTNDWFFQLIIVSLIGDPAKVLSEDSSFASYCLLETDNRTRFIR